MNFSQTQYDVFYLAREPPRTTGYIFQRASGSGRFVDIDVDDSLMDDLAAKQVYFDAMHTIDQYLSSISQHCVSSFRSNGMNADEIQYFGFPLYLMYTYNKQYMSVTVVPPSSHYFWYVLSRSKWTVVWWMDEWHVMSSAFVGCWTRRFLCWRCNPLGFRYSQRVPSTYWSRCRWCSGPRWIFWRWYSRPDGKSVLSKFYFQSILPPTPEQCRWTFTIFSGNRCHLSVG